MSRASSQALSLSAYIAGRLGPPSRGRVVAAFERTLYVELPGGLLLCVARPEVEEGALTLRASWPRPGEEGQAGHPLATGHPVEWDGRDLRVGEGWRIGIRGAPLWRPGALQRINPGPQVRARLEAVGASLARLAPGEGLGAMAGEVAKGKVPPAAGIPTEEGRAGAPFLESLLGGLEARDGGRVGRSLERLLGLGSGLTPAWDDFLGGMALGLRGGRRGDGKADLLARALAEHAPRLTHPISAAHLSAAAEGYGRASQHSLLRQLLDCPDPSGDLPAALRATKAGHTSGWDALAGLLLGLARSLF